MMMVNGSRMLMVVLALVFMLMSAVHADDPAPNYADCPAHVALAEGKSTLTVDFHEHCATMEGEFTVSGSDVSGVELVILPPEGSAGGYSFEYMLGDCKVDVEFKSATDLTFQLGSGKKIKGSVNKGVPILLMTDGGSPPKDPQDTKKVAVLPGFAESNPRGVYVPQSNKPEYLPCNPFKTNAVKGDCEDKPCVVSFKQRVIAGTPDVALYFGNAKKVEFGATTEPGVAPTKPAEPPAKPTEPPAKPATAKIPVKPTENPGDDDQDELFETTIAPKGGSNTLIIVGVIVGVLVLVIVIVVVVIVLVRRRNSNKAEEDADAAKMQGDSKYSQMGSAMEANPAK